jgi:hypothetical protein
MCYFGEAYSRPSTPYSVGMMQGNPRQVEHQLSIMSCPYRALDFGPIDELRKNCGNVGDLKDLASSSIGS